MSEGAPLRAAMVASMAAEQHAHEVEQLRVRLVDLALDGKSDGCVASLMRAVGEDLAMAKGPAAAAAAAATVAKGAAATSASRGSDVSEDAHLPARTADVAQQQEWAVRVGKALLGQLSSPADQVPEQELHWEEQRVEPAEEEDQRSQQAGQAAGPLGGPAQQAGQAAGVTMELIPGSLYKPPVGSKRMRDGLASPGAAEILLEWVLRTIGTADSQGEIRRRIFNESPTPALGEAVPRARQCLEENNHPDVAAVMPEHDRKRSGPWKTFEAAAGFGRIMQELQQAAAGTTQVFSPRWTSFEDDFIWLHGKSEGGLRAEGGRKGDDEKWRCLLAAAIFSLQPGNEHVMPTEALRHYGCETPSSWDHNKVRELKSSIRSMPNWESVVASPPSVPRARQANKRELQQAAAARV